MKALTEINQPDIVGITEVKPKHARFYVQECEIAVEGYELFHNLEEDGRGIALLVRKEMEPTPNDRLSSTFSEHVFVDCTQGDGILLTVGVIYRIPGSPSENDEKLFELIRNKAGIMKDNLLILEISTSPALTGIQNHAGRMNHMRHLNFSRLTLMHIFSNTRRKSRLSEKGDNPV